MNVLPNVGESLGAQPQPEAAGEVAWLAEGEIPKAAVTLLSGEPGSGKSFVACTLAASVSQAPEARVLFVHSEPVDRLSTRLIHAGADTSRVELIAVGGQGATEGFRVQGSGFSSKGFPQRLDVLIAWLAGRLDAKPTDLIVIDDLETLLGKALSAGELAEVTARLNELARTSGAAVLAVVRSATTTEGRVTARALDRLMRAADVVWTVAADRETSGRRWLVPLKNNLAALPTGKTFQMVEGRVQWLKGAVPDDALAPGSRRSLERIDRQTASEWLVEALRDQDVPSRLLYARARQCGFSRNTILRAAHKLGLHSHKSAFDGCWKYSLRDVPREVVDVYRTHPKWFTGGFGAGGSGKDSGFTVAGRSPDRLADCDRRSPETGDAGDLRSALPAGLGDPARTGVREEVTGQRSEAREGFTAGAGGQGSEIREERGRRVPGPGFSTMSAIGPSDASKTSENVEGSQEA